MSVGSAVRETDREIGYMHSPSGSRGSFCVVRKAGRRQRYRFVCAREFKRAAAAAAVAAQPGLDVPQ